MTKIFVTGIGTEVGKTVVSAIITEALKADYFKPIQAGDLDFSDTDKVKDLISNTKTRFHPNSYALQTAMSPHAAAEIDHINIDLEKIVVPETLNNIVIEGAGGLLVPLNNTATINDLILPGYKVIVVSRHYLGSINHTLLTLSLLENRGLDIAIIFNGIESTTTEEIIMKKSKLPIIGRIEEETIIDQSIIKKYANQFRDNLEAFIKS